MSHYPQANGQAEAAVKITVQKLMSFLMHAALARPDKKYIKGIWASILPQIVYSYNITYQKKLGCSPYQMMFGRTPPLMSAARDFEMKLWGDVSENYHIILKDILSAYHQQAEFKLKKHQIQVKKYFDAHRKVFHTNIGDFVYLTPAYSEKLPKLSMHLTGLYIVERVQQSQEIGEVTGICLNVGSINRPDYRLFPKYRVHPKYPSLNCGTCTL